MELLKRPRLKHTKDIEQTPPPVVHNEETFFITISEELQKPRGNGAFSSCSLCLLGGPPHPLRLPLPPAPLSPQIAPNVSPLSVALIQATATKCQAVREGVREGPLAMSSF